MRESFTVVNDKRLPAEVYLGEWSPDKDVVALAARDGQLALHRLNWQRLWAVAPSRPVTALGWRRDGRILAVGSEDGAIALHDVEGGALVDRCQPDSSPISALSWVSYDARSSPDGAKFSYEDRAPKFFPPCPKLPPLPGAAPRGSFDDAESPAGSSGISRKASLVQKDELSILCSGDRQGRICLWAYGIFLIAKIELGQLSVVRGLTEGDKCFQLIAPTVHKVSLSPDFRQWTAVCSAAPPGGSVGGGESLYLAFVGTSQIGQGQAELRQLALQAASLSELADVADQSLTAMLAHWNTAAGAVSERMKLLSTLLLDHGSSLAPRDEFEFLLASGGASSAMQQFLASSLGEQGLKRLSKAVDAAISQLQTILAGHLQPALEEAAFRLGELQGLAMWHERAEPLGIDPSLLRAAIENAGKALVQSERVLRQLSTMSSQYRAFFAWLLRTIRQLSEDSHPASEPMPPANLVLVAEFLRLHLEDDPIGCHLAVNDPCHVIKLSADEEEAAEETKLLGGFADSAYLRQPLRYLVDSFRSSCDTVFGRPWRALSPRLLPALTFCLTPGLQQPASWQIATALQEVSGKGDPASIPLQHYLHLALLTAVGSSDQLGDSKQAIAVLRVGAASARSTSPRLEAVALELRPHLRVLDFSFYKECQLVLLLEEHGAPSSGSAPPVTPHLLLLSLQDGPFAPLDEHFLGATLNSGAAQPPAGLIQFCAREGAVVKVGLEGGRCRTLLTSPASAPLVVGASRGLVCVFAAQRRVQVMDLEEDEEPSL